MSPTPPAKRLRSKVDRKTTAKAPGAGPLSSGAPSPIKALHEGPPSLQRYSSMLKELIKPVSDAQGSAVNNLKQCLALLSKRPPQFESFEEKKEFTVALNHAARLLGLRFACPSCGKPATLVCARGSTRTGAFGFGHSRALGNTTHGGRTTFPKLKLVSAPRDAHK